MIAAPTITNLSLDEIVNLESWFENYIAYKYTVYMLYFMGCRVMKQKGKKSAILKSFASDLGFFVAIQCGRYFI